MRAIIGVPVVFAVIEKHFGLFHPTRNSFAAIITDTHDDGTVDLQFFPPNAVIQHHAVNVAEGEQPGQFLHLQDYAAPGGAAAEKGDGGSRDPTVSAADTTSSGGVQSGGLVVSTGIAGAPGDSTGSAVALGGTATTSAAT